MDHPQNMDRLDFEEVLGADDGCQQNASALSNPAERRTYVMTDDVQYYVHILSLQVRTVVDLVRTEKDTARTYVSFAVPFNCTCTYILVLLCTVGTMNTA